MASKILFGKIWKLNTQKSNFITDWNPETETRHYEELKNGYKLTVTGMHDKEPYEWGYTAFYDGKPHAVYGRQDVDHITIFRLKPSVTAGLFELKGELAGGYRRSVERGIVSIEVSGKNKRGFYYDVLHYEI